MTSFLKALGLLVLVTLCVAWPSLLVGILIAALYLEGKKEDERRERER